jgi:hypothetical protein
MAVVGAEAPGKRRHAVARTAAPPTIKASPAESQGSGCGDARRMKAAKAKKAAGMPRASQEPAARGKARCMLQVR